MGDWYVRMALGKDDVMKKMKKTRNVMSKKVAVIRPDAAYAPIIMEMLDVGNWDEVPAKIRRALEVAAGLCSNVGSELKSRQAIAAIVAAVDLYEDRAPAK